jgi:hypothetical protein
VSSSQNPITDQILKMYEARDAEQRAQLDLQMAQTRMNMLGKTAVPTVIAALQAKAQKAAAQKEKIAKASAAGQATPQQMTPPLTDVNGQTSGRQSGQLLANAADLAAQTLGGGGVKRAGIPGAIGAGGVGQVGPIGTGGWQGINPGQPVISGVFGQGGGPPVVTAGPQPAPAPGAAGGMIAQPPAAPTPSIVLTPTGPGRATATQVLTPGQRWATGAGGILAGVLRKDPASAIQAGIEAGSGKRDLGTVAVPTPRQIGAQYGSGLSELEDLRQRTESSDPETSAAAKDAYDEGLRRVFMDAQDQGVDPASAVQEAVSDMTTRLLARQRTQAQKDADREAAFKDQERLLKERTGEEEKVAAYRHGLKMGEPTNVAANLRAQMQTQALQHFAVSGWDDLSPQERLVMPAEYQSEAARQLAPKVPPALAGQLGKEVGEAGTNQLLAQQLLDSPGFIDYFGTGSSVDAGTLNSRQALSHSPSSLIPAKLKDSAALTDKQAKWLEGYNNADFNIKNLRAAVIHRLAGAQIGPYERELYDGVLPKPGDSPERVKTKLGSLVELEGLRALRNTIIMETGMGTHAALQGFPLTDGRKLVSAYASKVTDLLRGQGVPHELASAQAREIIKGQFGLDPDRYSGLDPGEGALPAQR